MTATKRRDPRAQQARRTLLDAHIDGRCSGFTLMEVLIGITVASLALTAGFATLAFISDREQPVDRAAALALTGATTRGLLADWLGEARLRAPGRGEYFQGLDGNPSDDLVFPTTASTPLGIGTSVVHLYVDLDDGTIERGLVAELTERVTDEPRLIELIPQVASMQLRYLMPLQGTTGEWVDTWVNTRSLPQAIELTLMAAGQDTLPLLLQHRLLVPLETRR